SSLCPYCGVGCQTTYHIRDNRILYAEGRDGPANHSRLCVKGRFGGDYARHRHRLTKPLIRKSGVAKDPQRMLDPDDWREVFREAEWDEALDVAGNALRRIRDENGAGALAGFGSAKGSNEEAYLFQKLVRAGFGGNNVDHCTRLCHASSVAALLEGIGSGAVSNQVSDVLKTEVAIIIGANPTVNHPVAATMMKNAAARGVKLITIDPRGSALAEHAAMDMRIKPDSDVAFVNALMHVIIAEGMADEDFMRARTKDAGLLKAQVEKCSPELMAPICGVSADVIRAAARLYGGAARAMIFWGMGVSQHTHGTDNARCLIALAMLTGNIGRDGCGLHPLRGQNNVQGASDAGLIPMVFPDYKRVDDDAVRARFEDLWGCKLSGEPGLTVVEIINAAAGGEILGMYVMGENPAMSDPHAAHAREGLARLRMLAVQDIFLTETAALADVVFPASVFAEKTGTFTNTDRMVQLGRRALDLPGDARQDLWIICQMARRLGLEWDYPGEESGVARVFDEMRRAMPSIGGITWERLQNEHSVVYPCLQEGDAGEPVIFREGFPTADGRGRFVPARFAPAQELPDGDYPFVLITGRELEHWHTGAMTRRSGVLDALEPLPTVSMNPDDMAEGGYAAGDMVTVSSRRGAVSLAARADGNVPVGAVFIPFCYYEAAANILTNPALDPFGKIPEFKYCAVQITPGGEQPPPLSFGGGAALAQKAI
ncbi:MAG: formate dehydrogenase subunit alpha, partial [Gammaproteobacteria bacterium]